MKVKVILKSLLFSYAVTGAFLLLLAFLLFQFDLGEKPVSAGIVAVYILSCFSGGFMSGKILRKDKYLWGILVGAFYYLLLITVSFVVQGKWEMSLVHAVTTFFMCKESLFDVLVEEPARVLEERYRAIQKGFADQPVDAQVQTLPEVSDEGYSWMVEYIYDHFDAFKLIVCCSTGTRYEHYLDVLTEIEVNSSIVLMEKMKAAGYHLEELDENLIHMVASSMFNGMFETVRHDMPREKANSYMNSLREFYSAGWFRLLGIRGS